MAEEMLSAEELKLWDHVRSTKLDQLVGTNQHVYRIRPLLEDELIAVVATLKESTAAVETQTNLLQRQCEQLPLCPFERQPRGSKRTTRDLVGQIWRTDALELQQLHFALGEELEALTSSFQSATEDVLQTRKTTKQRLLQRLHDDDQTFGALQKLALPHGTAPNCEIDLGWKASRLGKQLADFTCEEIRCRLDRIYLERLHEAAEQEEGMREDPSTHEISLKNDLDALIADISDVVAISTSHEFQYPLLNSRHEDWQRQRTFEQQAIRSILRTLSQSTQSLEVAATNLESFRSYRASLDTIDAVCKEHYAAVQTIPRHDLWLTIVHQRPHFNEAAWKTLLSHIGVSIESSGHRPALEYALIDKLAKLRGSRSYAASSSDKLMRGILDVNDSSSQLLSRTSLRQQETPDTAKLGTSLKSLDAKISSLKGKFEDIDLSDVVEPSTAYKHFLDTWA